jgi:AmmeMemoRadiSam system protein B
MIWDPTYKPQLRPLEAFPLPDGHGPSIALRDRTGLSDVVLNLSEGALRVLVLMDGVNTCDDIRREFQTAVGQEVPINTFQSMLQQLEKAHFLEGPEFEAYYEAKLGAYREAGVRPMPYAAEHGIDESGSLFGDMLKSAEAPSIPGTIRGVVAPHLDYPRGRPCYAAAYGALRGRKPPTRVVILGTNHFGRSTSVVATANGFATPLGTVHTDRAFLERLEDRCGYLRTFELDHAREHSIELQVGWLQHLFGGDAFEIVPVLCPDPCGPSGTAPPDGQGVDLRDFAHALGELIADDPNDTLLVAGADLSHVGAEFGDEQRLDPPFLDQVRRRDRNALDNLEANNPTAFIEGVAQQDNPTRVCSAGCLFALTTAIPDARGVVLRYHQAVDQDSHRCVTCAAVAFT